MIAISTLKIEGADYYELLGLDIEQELNEHARAHLKLTMEKEKAENWLKQADMDKIKISAKVDKKDKVLFTGFIERLSYSEQVKYNLVEVDLVDASYMLDIKRANASYQKLEENHEDILKKAAKEVAGAKIQLKVTDKAIKGLTLRLNETCWEFAKRMASRFNAALFIDITAEKPLVTIGKPEPKVTLELKERKIKHQVRHLDFERMSANDLVEGTKIIKEDFTNITVKSYDFATVGDAVKVDNREYYIISMKTTIVENVLQMTYKLALKNGFTAPVLKNRQIAGRILRAQVKKVQNDKIQAHLIDIDEKYDDSSTMWYPFATPYSSGSGSGWYVMPEVGDYVRILLPTEEESEAFAISSINTAPLKETKNKSFKAPGGREILLTDKSVEIIAEHQKTFILLDKSGGISVVSAKDVNVQADGNINVESKGKIQILAQSEIDIQSGQAHVKLKSNQIAMGGNNIIVGE